MSSSSSERRPSPDDLGLALIRAGDNENLVRQLISRGADVKYVFRSGAKLPQGVEVTTTPLHEAASNGHANVVRVLIENGANIEERSWYGQTALHEAAENE